MRRLECKPYGTIRTFSTPRLWGELGVCSAVWAERHTHTHAGSNLKRLPIVVRRLPLCSALAIVRPRELVAEVVVSWHLTYLRCSLSLSLLTFVLPFSSLAAHMLTQHTLSPLYLKTNSCVQFVACLPLLAVFSVSLISWVSFILHSKHKTLGLFRIHV